MTKMYKLQLFSDKPENMRKNERNASLWIPHVFFDSTPSHTHQNTSANIDLFTYLASFKKKIESKQQLYNNDSVRTGVV